MKLDVILLDKTSLNKKLRDVLALIALELNYLSQLFVLNDIAVAAELLLKILEDLSVAEVFLQPLHRRETLLPVPLLNADMNILFSSGGIGVVILRKRIKRSWELDV